MADEVVWFVQHFMFLKISDFHESPVSIGNLPFQIGFGHNHLI